MTGYPSKRRRSLSVLSFSLGLLGLLFVPLAPEATAQNQDVRSREVQGRNVQNRRVSSEAAQAGQTSIEAEAQDAEKQETEVAAALDQEPLKWAEIVFLRNRAQLLRADQSSRRANVADMLNIGDALRTLRRARAELRFNDDSLARIGERATFQFTPNTRNFQLSNGTVLLIIPPARGRTTIQTPNATTGIQGSALFVRYIPETDTTIVGALTDNPNGPMILFNEDGTEQQSLRANEIGVIEGDRITELYRFDSELFWQSSALAEGFDYTQDSSTGSDPLDPVRQEIRDAISNQEPIPDDGNTIKNPPSFSRPSDGSSEEIDESAVEDSNSASSSNAGSADANSDEAEPSDSAETSSTESTDTSESADGGSPSQTSEQTSEQAGDEPSSEAQGSANNPADGTTSDSTTSDNNNSDDGPGPRGAALTASPSATDESQANTTEAAPADASAPSDSQAIRDTPADNATTNSTAAGGSAQNDINQSSDTSAENPPIIEAGEAVDGAEPAGSATDPIVAEPAAEPAIEPQGQTPTNPADVSDLVEAEDSEVETVVDIQFKGTPAEEYLSVPQSQVQVRTPNIGENNGLVPAEEVIDNGTDASEPEAVTVADPEAMTSTGQTASTAADDSSSATGSQAEKPPADIDEQTAGVDLDTPTVDTITGELSPAGLRDSQGSSEEGGAETPGAEGANSGSVGNVPGDVPGDVPANAEPLNNEPSISNDEPSIDADSPILSETESNPTEPVAIPTDSPVLSEGANPDVAEPVLSIEESAGELVQPSDEIEALEVETPTPETIESFGALEEAIAPEETIMPETEIEAVEVLIPEVEPEAEVPEVVEIPETEIPEVEVTEVEVTEVEVTEVGVPTDDLSLETTEIEEALVDGSLQLEPLMDVVDEGAQIEDFNESTNLEAGEQGQELQPSNESPMNEDILL